jgi:hypothetical protein
MVLLLAADVTRALVQAACGVSLHFLLHAMWLRGDDGVLCCLGCRLLLVKRVAAAAAGYAAAAAGDGGDGAWRGMMQQQQG